MAKSDQRIAELTRSVVKLTNFKTSVLKSLDGDDRPGDWNQIHFEQRKDPPYYSSGSPPYRPAT
jgi:hypothetical protein